LEGNSFEVVLRQLLAQDDWNDWEYDEFFQKIRKALPRNIFSIAPIATTLANIFEDLNTDPIIRARAIHWLEICANRASIDFLICERVTINPQPEFVEIFLNSGVAQRNLNTERGVAAILAANTLYLLQNFTYTRPSSHFPSYVEYNLELLRWLRNACYNGNAIISERAKTVIRSYETTLKEILRYRYDTELLDILSVANVNVEEDEIGLSYEVWQATSDNNWESLCDYDAKIVPELLTAFDEIGPYRAYDVRQAIRNLTQPDAQEAVCRVFISDNPRWLEAEDMRAAGYRPNGLLPFEQALFYFLTGDYESYDAVDFNRQMLKSTYGVANNEMRRRILEAVRESGQVEYLDIIRGQADGNIGRKEANIMVSTLVQHRRWVELWRLAIELPPLASIEAVQMLPHGGWQIGDKVSQELFKRLKVLVKNSVLYNLDELPLQTNTYLPWLNEPLKDSGAWLLRLNEINTILRSPALEPSTKAILEYVKTILQHYYRDAIEISDDLKILAGETDIEIED
jgi:hypothetical protein